MITAEQMKSLQAGDMPVFDHGSVEVVHPSEVPACPERLPVNVVRIKTRLGWVATDRDLTVGDDRHAANM